MAAGHFQSQFGLDLFSRTNLLKLKLELMQDYLPTVTAPSICRCNQRCRNGKGVGEQLEEQLLYLQFSY